MSMTFTTLQNAVSYWLDDPNFGYFTTTQVQFWINNAQKEVQKRLIQAGQHWYTKAVQTTTVLKQPNYDLPSDFLKMHRCEVIITGTVANQDESPSTIELITLNERDLEPSGIGTPAGHYVTQNTLFILPAPDTGGLNLRIHYEYLVADLVNGSDIPDIPPQYHEMIALLAAHDGHIKDQRDPSVLLGKIASYDALMKQDATQRQQDSPRHVVITQGDGFENLF